MKTKHWRSAGFGLLALALLGGGGPLRADDAASNSAATAAITCPPVVSGAELKEPTVLRAVNHVLSTTFTVESKQVCVPVQNPTTQQWSNQPMTLRTYVYPDPATKQLKWGFPGPTFLIRKQTEELANGEKAPQVTPGDRLKVLLVNNLPPDTTAHGACDNSCAAGTVCPTDTSKLPDPATCATPTSIAPLCCCWGNITNKWPDCFHGDNTTNLHFHGSHVSPQAPQDYVLLELRPKLGKGEQPEKDPHPAHARGVVAYGQYQYDVDPPPPTQAEGTHWYHPHKHGSVSLQVANGMPGALLIEGPFDDWLRAYYKGHLREHLLVLQQVQAETNFFTNPAAPAYVVNGQVSPVVHMQAGEVQRWRFINATMQVAAQVSVNFPTGVTVRQIAMDGVRFSPENYASQPLFSPVNPSLFNISPGNRADFLIQAPTTPGTYRITHHVASPVVSEAKKERLRRRDQGLLALEAPKLKELAGQVGNVVGKAEEPALVTLIVEGEKPQGKPEGKAKPKPKLPQVATAFPAPGEWPKMPWYLQNLQDKSQVDEAMTFEMSAGPGNPTTKFSINGVQYNDKCVNVTTDLGDTDSWLVQNSSVLAHPFHIHTNPFQLVEQGTIIDGKPVPFVKYASPVWQDTIALPVVNSSWDVSAGPLFNQQEAEAKCPGVCTAKNNGKWNGNWLTTNPGKESVCGCSYTGNGYVRFLHRYLEFTGEYVLHCHFLGHEDRGMMFGVQTVCKDNKDKFGKAKPYGQPECVPGNLIPAAPACPPASTATTAAPASQEDHSAHSGH